MPLGDHTWAKPAAEIAACVRSEDPDAFWHVHDYFFAHQWEFTPENLQKKFAEYASSLPTVPLE